jgi:hypothetical protein
MSIRRAARALGAALGALAVLPTAAHAVPVLTAPLKPCYVAVSARTTEPIFVAAAGFTQGAPILVQVDGVTVNEAVADGSGTLSGRIASPYVARRDRPFTLTLTERDNLAQTVSATSRVTALNVGVTPRRARPSSRVTFQGRGFTANRPLYAHYVKGTKRRRTVRLANPKGPCGTFKVRKRQFPFRPSPGSWSVRFDQQRRYTTEADGPFVRLSVLVQRILRRN